MTYEYSRFHRDREEDQKFFASMPLVKMFSPEKEWKECEICGFSREESEICPVEVKFPDTDGTKVKEYHCCSSCNFWLKNQNYTYWS